MVLPEITLSDLKPLPNLNECKCGSDNISIAESSILGIQNYAIIKCNKCGMEIKRRTYKKAEKAWNENNPKPVKFYEITYKTLASLPCRKSIVSGLDEFEAINNFREIGSSQRCSDIISIQPYKTEGSTR